MKCSRRGRAPRRLAASAAAMQQRAPLLPLYLPLGETKGLLRGQQLAAAALVGGPAPCLPGRLLSLVPRLHGGERQRRGAEGRAPLLQLAQRGVLLPLDLHQRLDALPGAAAGGAGPAGRPRRGRSLQLSSSAGAGGGRRPATLQLELAVQQTARGAGGRRLHARRIASLCCIHLLLLLGADRSSSHTASASASAQRLHPPHKLVHSG